MRCETLEHVFLDLAGKGKRLSKKANFSSEGPVSRASCPFLNSPGLSSGIESTPAREGAVTRLQAVSHHHEAAHEEEGGGKQRSRRTSPAVSIPSAPLSPVSITTQNQPENSCLYLWRN